MGQERIASLFRELADTYNELIQLNQKVVDIVDSIQAEYMIHDSQLIISLLHDSPRTYVELVNNSGLKSRAVDLRRVLADLEYKGIVEYDHTISAWDLVERKA